MEMHHLMDYLMGFVLFSSPVQSLQKQRLLTLRAIVKPFSLGKIVHPSSGTTIAKVSKLTRMKDPLIFLAPPNLE